jgi:tetratricopeptide (TPR) repeat protein
MALLLAFSVCLAGAARPAPASAEPAAEASVEVSEKARALFREGVQLLKAEDGADYYAAHQKFRTAYADSPSPKILGNLGLCALKLERYDEAREAYEKYLSDAPGVGPKERAAIGAELELLRSTTAELTLSASVAGFRVRDERRTKDGKLVVNDYQSEGDELTLGLRPGNHALHVEAPGYDPSTLSLQLERGARVEQRVELEPRAGDAPRPAPEADRPTPEAASEGLPLGFWIGLGVTGAAAIATGVMAGLTAAKHGEFDDAQAKGQLVEALELQSDGETFALTTDILVGVTGAAAVTTAVFLVMGLSADDGADTEPAARLQMLPVVGGHVLGAEARYAF